jgi:hypothetical protein
MSSAGAADRAIVRKLGGRSIFSRLTSVGR